MMRQRVCTIRDSFRGFFQISAFFALLLAICAFDNQPRSPLVMSRADRQGDTLSPFPTLKFAFSAPVENDHISLYLEPEDAAYHTELNAGRDTVALVVTGVLKGNTAYTVSPAEVITASTGSSIAARGVEFTFFTLSREREPNGFQDTSHQYCNPVFGDLYSAADTDFFCIADPAVTALYLRSYDGAVLGLGLSDTAGHDTAVTGREAVKYLAVPGGFAPPRFARVYSVLSTGRYELGTHSP